MEISGKLEGTKPRVANPRVGSGTGFGGPGSGSGDPGHFPEFVRICFGTENVGTNFRVPLPVLSST